MAISIDFFEKIDKFLNSGLPFGKIVTDYVIHFIPWINGLLWPLFAFISVIFFTSRIAKDSEVVALLSAGVSYRRFLVPYVVSASFVALLLFLGNHYLIPISNKKKAEFETEFLKKGRKKSLSSNIHFFLNPDEKIYARSFRQIDSVAQSFRVESFEDGQLVKIIKASQLKYNRDSSTWTLKDYEVRKVNGLRETYESFKGERKDTIFDFVPDDFIRHDKQKEMMVSSDLRNFIQKERQRGIGAAQTFEVELYRRSANPFTVILLTLLGAAIASRKTRGGMGIHLAIGAVLGSVLEVMTKISMTFSNNLGVSPMIGVWIPNLLFICITIYVISRAQK